MVFLFVEVLTEVLGIVYDCWSKPPAAKYVIVVPSRDMISPSPSEVDKHRRYGVPIVKRNESFCVVN